MYYLDKPVWDIFIFKYTDDFCLFILRNFTFLNTKGITLWFFFSYLAGEIFAWNFFPIFKNFLIFVGCTFMSYVFLFIWKFILSIVVFAFFFMSYQKFFFTEQGFFFDDPVFILFAAVAFLLPTSFELTACIFLF